MCLLFINSLREVQHKVNGITAYLDMMTVVMINLLLIADLILS